MATVFSIHEFELGPEVSSEVFEKFVLEEWVPAWSTVPGMGNFKLLKGDRGERDGKYAFTFEMESVERRDRLFPQPGVNSEEVDRMLASHPGLAEEFGSFFKEHTWSGYTVIKS